LALQVANIGPALLQTEGSVLTLEMSEYSPKSCAWDTRREYELADN